MSESFSGMQNRSRAVRSLVKHSSARATIASRIRAKKPLAANQVQVAAGLVAFHHRRYPLCSFWLRPGRGVPFQKGGFAAWTLLGAEMLKCRLYTCVHYLRMGRSLGSNWTTGSPGIRSGERDIAVQDLQGGMRRR